MKNRDEIKQQIKELKARLQKEDNTQNKEKLKEKLQTLIIDYNESTPYKITIEDTKGAPYAVFDSEDADQYYELS